jgi:hypothetical protein
VSSIYRDRTQLTPRTELQLSLLVQGGSLRSPRAARPRPGLRSCLRPAPARPGARPRAQQSAACRRRGWRGTSWLGQPAPRLGGATLARASMSENPGAVQRLKHARTVERGCERLPAERQGLAAQLARLTRSVSLRTNLPEPAVRHQACQSIAG